jgi:ATP-dependent DNA ligase
MPVKVLADLRRRLDPLARKTSPLSARPSRSRFGSPFVLSRVHWVEPKLVAEITYLTWTADSLLRHTVYVGLREDKPANQVARQTLWQNSCVGIVDRVSGFLRAAGGDFRLQIWRATCGGFYGVWLGSTSL